MVKLVQPKGSFYDIKQAMDDELVKELNMAKLIKILVCYTLTKSLLIGAHVILSFGFTMPSMMCSSVS